MIIDCHAHLDVRSLPVAQLIAKMDAHGITRAVLIARITEAVEPEKSATLLAIQRRLMNSDALRPVAHAASHTFYDENGELRSLWRPFTQGGRGYVKTMHMD